MQIEPKKKSLQAFPLIEPDIVDRLSKEADERTLQPQDVDWIEIHRQAALARNKG